MLRTLRNSLGRSQATVKAAIAPGARAADAAPLRILRDVVVLVQRRHQLVDDHAGVLVVERVVLGRPVGRPIAPFLRRRLRLIGPAARIDEHGEHHGNLPPIDQVVEHVRRADVALHVLERLPIVEDHQAGRRPPDRTAPARRPSRCAACPDRPGSAACTARALLPSARRRAASESGPS